MLFERKKENSLSRAMVREGYSARKQSTAAKIVMRLSTHDLTQLQNSQSANLLTKKVHKFITKNSPQVKEKMTMGQREHSNCLGCKPEGRKSERIQGKQVSDGGARGKLLGAGLQSQCEGSCWEQA